MGTRHKHRFASLIALAALSLVSCGDVSGGTAPTLPSLTDSSVANAESTTTVRPDAEDAMLEFAACMREHGVDMPDPSSGQSGTFSTGGDETSFETFEEASNACSPILEAAFGDFELSPEQEAEMRDQQLVFAQCMRDNGVDWPDPGVGGTGVVEIDPRDDFDPETVDRAVEACSEETFGDSLGGFMTIDPSDTARTAP